MEPASDRTQWSRRLQQSPSWLPDLLLGLGVTLVIAFVISADQGGRVNPDAWAYLFAGAFGALMLLRRRFPVAVLVATMLLLFAYYSLGYPAIGLAVPVAAALYSGAEQGHLAAALVVSVLLLIVSTYFRLAEGQPVAFLLGYELVSSVALMAAAIALGANTRAQRALRAEQEQIAALIAQEHAYRAEQRVQDERVRIARDLHDVIGHSIAVVSLHANVAREAIGNDDDGARQALVHIQDAAAATLRELRATVKLLRTPAYEEPGFAPVDRSPASLAHLPALVEQAEASGLHVQVQAEGDLHSLPATVDAATYRIVQESLTNVLRHAAATEVSIAITLESRVLRLRISDNGRAARRPVEPGSGIAGMMERARLLGGALVAQPRAAGGFEVAATLPLEDGR